MSADNSAADNSFRCPVCRAGQPLQNKCRRCRADLTLVVRARRRLHFVIEQRERARNAGDRQRECELTHELEQLSPNRK